MTKVAGEDNPTDAFTKHLGGTGMWNHLKFLDMSAEDGRTAAVPGI